MNTLSRAFFVLLLLCHTSSADVDSVLERMTAWSGSHPSVHMTSTASQGGITTIVDGYSMTYSGTEKSAGTVSGNSPSPYSYTFRSLPDGSVVAIFPLTEKIVYVAEAGQNDDSIASLDLLSPGDPDAYKNIKKLSTSSSGTSNLDGTDTLAFELDIDTLIDEGLVPAFAEDLTVSFTIDSVGKIISVTQAMTSAPTTTIVFDYISTDFTTINSYISGLPAIDTNEIDTNLSFQEALEAELSAGTPP